MPKICPVMSGPATVSGNGVTERHAETVEVYCRENDCQWYIKPYTTEGLSGSSGCAIELAPMMKHGLLVV